MDSSVEHSHHDSSPSVIMLWLRLIHNVMESLLRKYELATYATHATVGVLRGMLTLFK